MENQRFDHTDWLIHFVRDRNPEQDFYNENTVVHLSSEEISFDADAFYVLLTIIRLGGLLPGYSFRNGRTTIYGGQPAVCATEMPIYSFAKYVKERAKTDAASAYGVAFLKSEFYEAGGRPVIYGLSSDEVFYKMNTKTKRIFDETILPLNEQYRYVAYNPSRKNWIDWTHEREWRWIARDKDRHQIWAMDESYIHDAMPGLPLFAGKENEGFFSKICIIVWTHEEALRIQEELTGYYWAESNGYGLPFSRELVKNSFIIVLNDVIESVEINGRLEAQTIEGIESSKLIKSVFLFENTVIYEDIIMDAIKRAVEAGKDAADNYLKEHPLDSGSCGYASIVCYNTMNPVIQQILKMDINYGVYDGKLVIYLDGDWPPRQSIDYNEYVFNAMCEILNSKLGNFFHIESRLD